jgi:hypothetical protein
MKIESFIQKIDQYLGTMVIAAIIMLVLNNVSYFF